MKRFVIHLLVFILAISPWIISTKILFLKDPPVWPDEAIFTETALNIIDHGVMRTDLFGGAVPGLSTRALWYPPLYFYILAGWIKIFGAGIEAIRALSVAIAFLSLVFVFVIFKRLTNSLIFTAMGLFCISYTTLFLGFMHLLYRWIFFTMVVVGLVIFSGRITKFINELLKKVTRLRIGHDLHSILHLSLDQ